MSLRIIPFEEKYIEAVCEIENVSLSDPWSKSAFCDFSDPIYAIYLALDSENTFCGYIVASFISPECEILNLAVSPAFRRKGVADSLLGFLFAEAKKRDCDTVLLDVRASNEPAISLYEKHGFYKVGVRKGYYTLPREDAVLMDKPLN